MVNECAYNWRQATPGRENQMNDAFSGLPLREDVDQAAARQFAPARMIRKKCYAKASHRGIANRLEVNAGHPRFVANGAWFSFWSRELPDDFTHLVGGGECWEAGENCHIAVGAKSR